MCNGSANQGHFDLVLGLFASSLPCLGGGRSQAFTMRYAILVCGPAGAGKSTFCTALQTHMQTVKRNAHLFNLDPAADPGSFEYEPAIDIRDLIRYEPSLSYGGYTLIVTQP